MQLAGLTLAQMLTVLGVAGTITVGLYLLRTRRRRVEVPFIALWETLLRDERSSRLFHSLRHLLSLLLALLVVALLTFALGDPRESEDSADVEHLVLLVDAGATMQATDVAPSRLGVALERARALVATAGPRRRMLVAQLDASVTPLSAMSGDRRALDEALRRIAPSHAESDHVQGLRFAAAVLAGRSDPKAVLLSDRHDALPPALMEALAKAGVALELAPIGRRNDNLAVSAFALRRYPLDKNRSELLVEVYNSSEHDEQVELTLHGDDAVIDVQSFEVAAGARLRRVYDDITGVRRGLEASIRVPQGDHDDLALDDRAYAVVPERKALSVLCVTEGNRYLEAALLLDEYLSVATTHPTDYRDAQGYDVVIFDGTRPALPPGVPALYLGLAPDQPGEAPVRVGPLLQHPYFERIARKHPLMRFTALSDVNVASAYALAGRSDDVVIAGDANGALVLAGEREGVRFVALGFDIRNTDLPLRVAWPVMLLNVLEWFTTNDGESRSTYAVGERVSLAVPADVSDVVHVAPDGAEQTLSVERSTGGTVASLVPEMAGFHRLRWDGGELMFATNLAGATLRALDPAREMVVAGVPVPSPEVGEPTREHPAWVLLAIVALFLLIIEWLTFHRRWTV